MRWTEAARYPGRANSPQLFFQETRDFELDFRKIEHFTHQAFYKLNVREREKREEIFITT